MHEIDEIILYNECIILVNEDKKFSAIKRCRELTGWCLKDARDYIWCISDGSIVVKKDWIDKDLFKI